MKTEVTFTVWTLEPCMLWLYFHFIFTYFVVIFYIFPELTNHIHKPKQWHRHFFSFFPCFYRSTQHNVWDAFQCAITHVYQTMLVVFLAGIHCLSQRSDMGFQFRETAYSSANYTSKYTFIQNDAFLDTFVEFQFFWGTKKWLFIIFLEIIRPV